MRLSEQFAVPPEAALAYDFLNTLDLRDFVENGVAHQASDQIASAGGLEAWLDEQGLLATGQRVSAQDHAVALGLRAALREYVAFEPATRLRADVAESLNRACAPFPMVMAVEVERLALRPAAGTTISGLSRVIAQLYLLSESGKLDRLKACDSADCRWVFFDRSKPGNRRWCSSDLCGNRQKTRDYRLRHRGGGASVA
jgi:predicted RNA-binding Zn ribbon-like protein